MGRITVALSAVLMTFAMQPGKSSAADVVISGTGMALAATRQAADAFMADEPGVRVNVLPSMGSGGGIKALTDGVLDLSLSARRLKPKEVAAGIQEKFCFLTALIFATSGGKTANIKTTDLPSYYADANPMWADGSALKVILRASSGSEMPYLAKRVPGLEEAFKIARKRPETPVGMTDQLNASLAEGTTGSLAITSLLQLVAEERRLSPLSVNGVYPSPATLKSEAYPFSMMICVLGKEAAVSNEAQKFMTFLKSDEGRAVFDGLGALPVD